MKSFLKSKTIWGTVISLVNATSIILGGDTVIDAQLAENISDGGLNTQNWLHLGAALFGGALTIYGRKEATDKISFHI